MEENYRKYLIGEMQHWVSQDTSVRLEDLCKFLEMRRDTFFNLMKKYPDLWDAYYGVKRTLEIRRKQQRRRVHDENIQFRKELGL